MTGISERVTELVRSRTPFVQATVVRAQPPTSARAGDEAIVLADGRMEGFVGGQCTQNSVRTAALAALADGSATLLRVLPDATTEFPATPGAQVVVNPCQSGGAIEIFLQPVLPPAVVAVTGSTPIAQALRATVAFLGYTVGPSSGLDESIRTATDLDGCVAVVLASHGPGEAETLRAALDADVPYIALVASHRRGSGVLDEAGLTPAERARVRSPAGMWIGARTAPEIALSIMAEVVAAVRGVAEHPKIAAHPAAASGSAPSAAVQPAAVQPAAAQTTATSPTPARTTTTQTAAAPAAAAPAAPRLTPLQTVDPVCSMVVTVMPDTPHLAVQGTDYYFCNPGCRRRFARQHGMES